MPGAGRLFRLCCCSTKRLHAQGVRGKEILERLAFGKIQQDLLREAGVRYIVVSKSTEGLPATIPAIISNVFENSEFAVFKVDPQRLSETVPQTP